MPQIEHQLLLDIAIYHSRCWDKSSFKSEVELSAVVY